MAKFNKIAMSKAGSTPILSPKSTIHGPEKLPIFPKASVIPTAVDWISTVKDYVWTEAIRV